MDPLAEFVAAHAPGLVGAVPLRAGFDTDTASAAAVDADVARLLADVWLAGAPYDVALARVRRRLTTGFSATTDLVDLGAHDQDPPDGTRPAADLTPTRRTEIERLVRRRVEQRTRRAGVDRVLQGAVAAGLAVVLALVGIQLVNAGTALRASRPSTQTSTPAAISTIASPAATTAPLTTGCPYEVCRWESVQIWAAQTRTIVHRTLDPQDTVFAGSANRAMVTTVAEVTSGRMIEAGFGNEVIGSTADFGVTVTVTSRRELLPACGQQTGGRCTKITDHGHQVTMSRSPRGRTPALEAFYRLDQGSWVHVITSATTRLPFTRAQVITLVTDEHLRLPS